MRRLTVALVLATTLLFGLTASPLLARSDASVPTVGDRLDLRLGDQDFPASTPFYIAHGFIIGIDSKASGRYAFVLDLDGTALAPDFFRVSEIVSNPNAIDGILAQELWYYNFPDGLTGIHEFTRHYFAPCDNISVSCDGNPINTPVEYFTASAVVTFTP